MQDDLGYRKYNNSCDTIMCPECGIEHDIILKCPNCGMSYEELLKKTEKIINQSLEGSVVNMTMAVKNVC